jgi:hypothetical protein
MSSELKKASVGGKFFGSIVLFLVFALAFWIAVPAWRYFFPGEKGLDTKRAEARATKLEALQKDNDQKLTAYAWVDKDKQIVQVPIAQAMKLVIPELTAKKVQASAVKLENPYPHTDWDTTIPAATGSAAPAASGTAAPAPTISGTVGAGPSGAVTTGTLPSAAPAATPTPGQ